MKPHPLKNTSIGCIENIARKAGLAMSVLLLGALAAPASASVIIHDDFTTWNQDELRPTTATATTDNTGLSNNYWTFIDTAYYEAGRDRIIAAGTSSGTGGFISTGTMLNSRTTGIIEVSGKFLLNNQSIAEPQTPVPVAWGAVGFMSAHSNVLNEGGLLWGLVTPDGGWALFAGGTGTLLMGNNESTKLPAFPVSTDSSQNYTDISIKYDITNSAAALFVDSSNVSGWVSYGLSVSSIAGTGFRTYPNAGSQPRTITLNEFTVSAIPEPSSAAALAGLVTVGFAAGARRRRSM